MLTTEEWKQIENLMLVKRPDLVDASVAWKLFKEIEELRFQQTFENAFADKLKEFKNKCRTLEQELDHYKKLYCGGHYTLQDLQKLEAELQAAKDAIAEQDKSFELYDAAMRRGTAIWRAKDPEKRKLTLPDTAKLVEWLLEQLEDVKEQLQTEIIRHHEPGYQPLSQTALRLEIAGLKAELAKKWHIDGVCRGCGRNFNRPEVHATGCPWENVV